MESVEMMALITENPDDAHDALLDLKRLEQAGWIDLTYYALVDKDPSGNVRVEEASDPVESLNSGPGEGLAGGLIGHLFGPGGSSGSSTTDAAISGRIGGSSDGRHARGTAEAKAPGLQPGKSALLVVLDERYAERVGEELENRGRILHRQLERAERLAALRASIERMKMDVKWLEEFLQGEAAKAVRAVGTEKDELEATIAAARAELGAQCENLNQRLRSLVSEIESDLEETTHLLKASGDGNRQAIEQRIDVLESAINECTEELAASVLDHMDRLAAHATALEERASGVGSDVELEIEGQLHEIEVRMRKHRAELTAALGASALRARRCMERLRLKAACAAPESRHAIQEELRLLNDRHTIFRADLRQIEKEDAFLWQDFADGIRQSWRDLCESISRTNRQSL